MPSSPGSQDSALPQNQAQQAGAGSQAGQSLDTVKIPVEEVGSSSPLQGQTAEGTGSGTGGVAQKDPAPSDLPEVKDPNTSKPSVDKGLSREGGSGPALSVLEGCLKETDVSQKAPAPDSKGEKSEPEEDVPVSGKQASEVSSRKWGPGVGHVLCPWLWPPWDLLPGQGRDALCHSTFWLTEATVEVLHFVTQGSDALCFFQPTNTTGKAVKKAGKETADNAQKQKPSPVSPAASKDRDQVET